MCDKLYAEILCLDFLYFTHASLILIKSALEIYSAFQVFVVWRDPSLRFPSTSSPFCCQYEIFYLIVNAISVCLIIGCDL